MSECGDKKCKKTVEDLDNYVFGPPGKGEEIRTCMLKLVPKKWLWAGFTTFGLSSLLFGVVIYADVQTGKKDHEKHVETIADMKQDIKEIHQKTDKNTTKLIKIETILEEKILKEMEKIPKK